MAELFYTYSYLVREQIPCKQWFLQAGRYATKQEKPLRASVCFFDRAAIHGMYRTSSEMELAFKQDLHV